MDVDPNDLVIPAALDDEGTGDLLAATQEPVKRVRPEFVNYARKAKRVDVRKLKENIWKGMNIVTEPEDPPEVRRKLFTFVCFQLRNLFGRLIRRCCLVWIRVMRILYLRD